MIKKIKLFVNHNDQSMRLAKLVKENFVAHGFIVTDDSFDLGIAIGGDGAFLRMAKQSNYDPNVYYVGINAGTLGFLQEVNASEIDKLIYVLQNEIYKVDEMSVQQTDIHHHNKIGRIYSLNEIIVRDEELKTTKLDVLIDDSLLEHFVGDGLMISTSIGSTGHNLSYGGSIVYSGMPTLQITPLAPINSRAFHTIKTSVIIPEKKEIVLLPVDYTKNIMLTADGESTIYKNVDGITTAIKDKKIKCLRLKNYNFSQKVNDKLLS